MSELKPRKRYIDYKAGKIFGGMQLKVVARKEGLKVKPIKIDPLELEIAELEFKLKQALGRIRDGRFPKIVERDKKLVEELRERIEVLKGRLTRKVGDSKKMKGGKKRSPPPKLPKSRWSKKKGKGYAFSG